MSLNEYPKGITEYLAVIIGASSTLYAAVYYAEMPFYALVLFSIGIFSNIAAKPMKPNSFNILYWGYIVLIYFLAIVILLGTTTGNN